MVNIRATVSAALKAGVISEEQQLQIIAAAKSLYYGDRNWPRILEDVESGLAQAVTDWLPGNEVDQKQADAVLLLNGMAEGNISGPSVNQVQPFLFEQTRLWESATEQWKRAARPLESTKGGFRVLGDDHS